MLDPGSNLSCPGERIRRTKYNLALLFEMKERLVHCGSSEPEELAPQNSEADRSVFVRAHVHERVDDLRLDAPLRPREPSCGDVLDELRRRLKLVRLEAPE
ncbi:hypothetical protein [Polyangium fumosum]|uniref:Uncharacterized protein n=1 Tax=Polyangium fumosum TaxID=889272 RepID=A0A4U1J941_9BACT|nr:hypothetical protein [Polyangium fumosum]TKD03387.1 hypothetical protein E8A74_25820 [Polyangium fumosum]